MANLPQSVRARLAAQQAAGEHPDADLLTAFAEGALADRERQSVIAHLAACGPCREVLALITPAEGPPLPGPAPRRSWLAMPAVRWATAAVTAVIVLAAVMLYRSETRTVMRSDKEIIAPVAQAPAKPAAESAASIPDQQKEAEAAPAEPPRERRQVGAAPTLHVRQPEALSKLKEMPEAKKDQLAEYKAAPPPSAVAKSAAPPAANVVVSRPAPPVQDARAETVVGGFAADRASTVKSKGAAAPQAYGMMQQRPMAPVIVSPVRVPSASWSITPDGKVERTSAGMAPETVAIDKRVAFHAVATIGLEVWAGGSGGALFHSTDAGQTWTRVASPVTEDIVALEFRNAREGRLRTASGHQYATHDAGKSWISDQL